MKKNIQTLTIQLILLLFISLFSTTTWGQSWSVVGSAGFSAGNAEGSNIEVDAATNTPYVAFVDAANSSNVTVMTYNGTAWVNVGSPGFAGASSTYSFDLAVYNNVPYLAFRNSNNSGKITVMKYNGTAWVNVGSPAISTGAGTFPTIAIYNGTPYVAFGDDDNFDQARTMQYNGSSWVNVGGLLGGSATFHLDLAFNNGAPHLAYYTRLTPNNHNIKLSTFNGTSWTSVGGSITTGIQQIDSPLDLEFINNVPYVSYFAINYTTFQAQVYVKKHENSAWANVGSLSANPPGLPSSDVNLFTGGNSIYVFYNTFSDTTISYIGNMWVPSLPSAAGAMYLVDIIEQNGTVWVSYKDPSNSNKLTVQKYDLALGVEKLTLVNNRVNLYPNPVAETFNIETEEPILSVSILSIDGQFIKSTKRTTDVSVKELSQGIYLVQVQTEKGIEIKRFIKK
jgi:hypothetical protein